MPAAQKRTPRFAAHTAVSRIERDNAYTDIVLSHILERTPFEKRDRAFITELVRGTIRWKKRFDWIIDQLFTGKKNQMPDEVRWLLWQGLYQLEFMNVPAFAAVNECVKLARSQKQHRWSGVINGILRSFIRHPEAVTFPDVTRNPVSYLAVTESHPEWMVKHFLSHFGFEKTQAICRANNRAPDLSVRVNDLNSSAAELVHVLAQHNAIFSESVVPGFYRITDINYDLRSQLLAEGKITVQDESAGLVGLLVNPKPGQIVADVCAAPGGKATHLAELMRNQGVILCGDLKRVRVGLIKKAAERLNVACLFPVVADAGFFPVRHVDIVLLDAPCSGLGVIRKKPDVRWKKVPADLSDLVDIQRRLIQNVSTCLKKGGVLVYSTCTINPEENEKIIDEFLGNNPDFSLVHARTQKRVAKEFITDRGFIRTWPHEQRMDGSFAAKLIKT